MNYGKEDHKEQLDEFRFRRQQHQPVVVVSPISGGGGGYQGGVKPPSSPVPNIPGGRPYHHYNYIHQQKQNQIQQNQNNVPHVHVHHSQPLHYRTNFGKDYGYRPPSPASPPQMVSTPTYLTNWSTQQNLQRKKQQLLHRQQQILHLPSTTGNDTTNNNNNNNTDEDIPFDEQRQEHTHHDSHSQQQTTMMMMSRSHSPNLFAQRRSPSPGGGSSSSPHHEKPRLTFQNGLVVTANHCDNPPLPDNNNTYMRTTTTTGTPTRRHPSPSFVSRSTPPRITSMTPPRLNMMMIPTQQQPHHSHSHSGNITPTRSADVGVNVSRNTQFTPPRSRNVVTPPPRIMNMNTNSTYNNNNGVVAHQRSHSISSMNKNHIHYEANDHNSHLSPIARIIADQRSGGGGGGSMNCRSTIPSGLSIPKSPNTFYQNCDDNVSKVDTMSVTQNTEEEEKTETSFDNDDEYDDDDKNLFPTNPEFDHIYDDDDDNEDHNNNNYEEEFFESNNNTTPFGRYQMPTLRISSPRQHQQQQQQLQQQIQQPTTLLNDLAKNVETRNFPIIGFPSYHHNSSIPGDEASALTGDFEELSVEIINQALHQKTGSMESLDPFNVAILPTTTSNNNNTSGQQPQQLQQYYSTSTTNTPTSPRSSNSNHNHHHHEPPFPTTTANPLSMQNPYFRDQNQNVKSIASVTTETSSGFGGSSDKSVSRQMILMGVSRYLEESGNGGGGGKTNEPTTTMTNNKVQNHHSNSNTLFLNNNQKKSSSSLFEKKHVQQQQPNNISPIKTDETDSLFDFIDSLTTASSENDSLLSKHLFIKNKNVVLPDATTSGGRGIRTHLAVDSRQGASITLPTVQRSAYSQQHAPLPQQQQQQPYHNPQYGNRLKSILQEDTDDDTTETGTSYGMDQQSEQSPSYSIPNNTAQAAWKRKSRIAARVAAFSNNNNNNNNLQQFQQQQQTTNKINNNDVNPTNRKKDYESYGFERGTTNTTTNNNNNTTSNPRELGSVRNTLPSLANALTSSPVSLTTDKSGGGMMDNSSSHVNSESLLNLTLNEETNSSHNKGESFFPNNNTTTTTGFGTDDDHHDEEKNDSLHRDELNRRQRRTEYLQQRKEEEIQLRRDLRSGNNNNNNNNSNNSNNDMENNNELNDTTTTFSLNSFYTKSAESEVEDIIKDIFMLGDGETTNPGRRKMMYNARVRDKLEEEVFKKGQQQNQQEQQQQQSNHTGYSDRMQEEEEPDGPFSHDTASVQTGPKLPSTLHRLTTGESDEDEYQGDIALGGQQRQIISTTMSNNTTITTTMGGMKDTTTTTTQPGYSSTQQQQQQHEGIVGGTSIETQMRNEEKKEDDPIFGGVWEFVGNRLQVVTAAFGFENVVAPMSNNNNNTSSSIGEKGSGMAASTQSPVIINEATSRTIGSHSLLHASSQERQKEETSLDPTSIANSNEYTNEGSKTITVDDSQQQQSSSGWNILDYASDVLLGPAVPPPITCDRAGVVRHSTTAAAAAKEGGGENSTKDDTTTTHNESLTERGDLTAIATDYSTLEDDVSLIGLAVQTAKSLHKINGFEFDETQDINVADEIKFIVVKLQLPLGLIFQENPKGCWVTCVLAKGSAAATKAVLAGDQLVAIDGVNAVAMSVDEIAYLVRQNQEQSVELTFLRYVGPLRPEANPIVEEEGYEIMARQNQPPTSNSPFSHQSELTSSQQKLDLYESRQLDDNDEEEAEGGESSKGSCMQRMRLPLGRGGSPRRGKKKGRGVTTSTATTIDSTKKSNSNSLTLPTFRKVVPHSSGVTTETSQSPSKSLNGSRTSGRSSGSHPTVEKYMVDDPCEDTSYPPPASKKKKGFQLFQSRKK